MQESPVSLSLNTPTDELNLHPVMQVLAHLAEDFMVDHWKDSSTGTWYCKIVYQSQDHNLDIDSTRFFNYWNDLDEYFINEIMYIYNRLTAN
jgi:hypothetical protein